MAAPLGLHRGLPVPAPASIPLIATKLQPPRASGARLARPRLGELAARVLEVPLALVSAPAGFGKSTLLLDWIERLGETARIGWISLDETDNDPEQLADRKSTRLNSSH